MVRLAVRDISLLLQEVPAVWNDARVVHTYRVDVETTLVTATRGPLELSITSQQDATQLGATQIDVFR